MALRINGYAIDHIKYNGAIITAKPQRLKSCEIDIDNGTVDYTLEGDENHYGLTFAVTENKVLYTWPDGFQCLIKVLGDIEEPEEEEE